MNKPHLEFRPATVEDAPELTEVLQQAAVFKASLGDNIWGPEPFTDKETIDSISGGNTYIALSSGELAGSLVVLTSDERIWGAEKGTDGKAIYLHRLAVGESFRGQHVGELMMKWAIGKARELGKTLIRLDCSTDNEKLCEYYDRNGFKEVGRKVLMDPYYGVSFREKRIKTLRKPDKQPAAVQIASQQPLSPSTAAALKKMGKDPSKSYYTSVYEPAKEDIYAVDYHQSKADVKFDAERAHAEKGGIRLRGNSVRLRPDY